MHRRFALFCLALSSVPALAAELTSREKRMVDAVNATVRQAGTDYAAGNFDAAGESVRRGMKQIDVAVKAGSGELYDALGPAMTRMIKAHAMLELEGVSLPPFRRPERPTGKPAEPMNNDKPTSGSPTANPNAISFSKQVAPILASRCGRCHIQGNKGNFTMATFAALMKGPPEGVVVFAGDTVGSRLIETIETGDMPRGGKVSPPELQTLKAWIMQGATFDGTDSNAPLTGGAAAVPQNSDRPEVKMATGKETVSFAADVAPLLVENCSGCHIDAMQTRGGLRMDTFAQILSGGDSGEIVLPGRSAESLLIRKLKGEGIEGERMPLGGRPPLDDDSIKLIAKWIDEGATLDGSSATQPISVMSQLAWAASATAAQMTEKRGDLANKKMKLASAGATVNSEVTDHFLVVGTASAGMVELVAREAEAHMKVVSGLVTGGAADEYFHGRATIFVLPRRYDYSEFAKMVESRSVPSQWTSHWKFDGIDGYVAMVATDSDDDEAVSDRLLSPLVSLAVATRAGDVPRWFAEGVGAAMAARKGDRERAAKLKREAETSEAIAAMSAAKNFLTGKLTPVQSDRIGAALAESMLDRSRKKSFDACLRLLGEGQAFDTAFSQAFRYPVATYVDNWLKWARGG